MSDLNHSTKRSVKDASSGIHAKGEKVAM